MLAFLTSFTGVVTMVATVTLMVMTARASYENGNGLARAIGDGIVAPYTLVMGAVRKLVKD